MNKKKATGISLIALIITIIVIIILAAIVVSSGLKTPESAGKAKFLGDLSQIKESVSIKRVQNLMQTVENPTGDKNYRFTKVIIRKTADSEPEDGWVVNLEVLNIKNSTRGMAYAEVIEGSEIIFGADAPDVYVYDSKGEIYYARGYRDGKNIIYAQSYITGIDDAPGNWTYSTVAGTDIILDDTFDNNAFVKINGRSEQYIPSGYTFYDYIESTGTQYINTGFNPNQDSAIDIKIATLDFDGWTSKGYFGSRTSYLVNSFALQSTSSSTGNGNLVDTYGTNNITLTSFITNGVAFRLLKDRNKTYINDSLVTEYIQQTYTPSLNLYLFRLNGHTGGSCRIYSCKIYDNDTLIRNYIGAKRNSDNAIGMYDLVNNVFYPNAGTGSFTVGNVITLPHPDHPIEIKSVKNFDLISTGKNLFDYTKGAYSTTSTNVTLCDDREGFVVAGNSSGTNRVARYSVTNLKINTTYKFSYNSQRTGESGGGVFIYDGDGTGALSGNSNDYGENRARNFTTVSSAVNIYFFASSSISELSSATFWNMQLEEGIIVTPYEPFKGQTVINFPYTLRSLPDGTKDYIEIDNINRTAKLYQNVGEYIVTGEENWKEYKANVYQLNEFVTNVVIPSSVLNTPALQSSHFIAKSANTVSNGSSELPGTALFDSVNKKLWFRIPTLNTIEDFKTWLATQHSEGTPVTVQYQLATPIITNLDYEEVVTYYPYTKIYTNAVIQPNMEVTYKKLESQ